MDKVWISEISIVTPTSSLIHALIHAQRKASLLNAGLSGRMSRSEMAVFLTSPPTVLQVVTADIANGIIETKILYVLGVWSKWVGWTLHVVNGVWYPRSSSLPW